MRRRTVVWWVGLVVLLGACGGGEAPSAPVASPTTTTADSSASSRIDEAYVNGVLAVLDAAVGDVVRLVYRDKAIMPEAVERLDAIFGKEFADLNIVILQGDLDLKFVNYRVPPGDRITTVVKMLSVRDDCVFAEVSRDYSAVTSKLGREQEWIALVPRTPNDINSSGWALDFDGFSEGEMMPSDPCAR